MPNVAKLSARGDVRRLIKALRARHNEVRTAAAKALGDIGDARAVEPLTAALGDVDSDVRTAAASALVMIGELAIEPLLSVLTDTNANELKRRGAVRVLGRTGDRRAVGALVAARADQDPRLHEAAKPALRRIGDALLDEMGDAFAVEPLMAFVQDLADVDTEVRWAFAEAVGEFGEAAVEPLMSALRQQDPGFRGVAAGALGVIGDARAVEPLSAALDDKDSGVRAIAARALGVIGDARAVEPLSAALDDKVSGVREEAANALGVIGDARAVEPLSAALDDEDSGVRAKAARALGSPGIPKSVAVEPLSAALDDKDSGVREEAASALVWKGDARAVEPLSAALDDKVSGVRAKAAWALGRIEDARAVEPLSAALDDKVSGVREQAQAALDRIERARADAAPAKRRAREPDGAQGRSRASSQPLSGPACPESAITGKRVGLIESDEPHDPVMRRLLICPVCGHRVAELRS